MKIKKTPFKDLYIIEPKIFEDSRGYFFESFNQKIFEKQTGIRTQFVQDNQSRSSRGVIRGLHFQRPPYAQTKLVRVLQGSVLDVVVDLRQSEPTYGKSYAIVLDDHNKRQLYIPAGFAHGIAVLSDTCEFFYKSDNYYHPKSDGGIYYDDPKLKITWPYKSNEATLSEKDKKLPLLEQIAPIFD